MSEPTKICNLTEDEIKILIKRHGFDMSASTNAETKSNSDYHIERINYLNKRLKTFNEPAAEVASVNNAAGWGNNG